jgi:hypothetical protein
VIVVLGVVFSLALLAIVIRLLILRRIREKYAVLWLVLGVIVLVLGVFPGVLEAATDALGVELPVNLLFATALAVLLGVALHLSWELSMSEDETRRLAEDVAILSARLDALESDQRSDPPRRSGAAE